MLTVHFWGDDGDAWGKKSKMGLCLEVLQALCPSGAAVMRWIYIFIFVVNTGFKDSFHPILVAFNPILVPKPHHMMTPGPPGPSPPLAPLAPPGPPWPPRPRPPRPTCCCRHWKPWTPAWMQQLSRVPWRVQAGDGGRGSNGWSDAVWYCHHVALEFRMFRFRLQQLFSVSKIAHFFPNHNPQGFLCFRD